MLFLVSCVDGVFRSVVHFALQLCLGALFIHNFIGRARRVWPEPSLFKRVTVRVAQNNWRARSKRKCIVEIARITSDSSSAKADSSPPSACEVSALLLLAGRTHLNDRARREVVDS